jgi:hypothetical protein
MCRPLLIGLYVAWPLMVSVLRVTARVRRRFVLVSAAGWFGAAVIATTARPAERALAVGLVCGIAVSLFGWLSTSRGVTLTWEQDKTYWPDNEPIPTGEKVAAVLMTMLGLLGLVIGLLAA